MVSEELKPVAKIMGLADDYADARADETLITERGGVHLDPDSNDARAKLMLAVSALQSRMAELDSALAAARRNEARYLWMKATTKTVRNDAGDVIATEGHDFDTLIDEAIARGEV